MIFLLKLLEWNVELVKYNCFVFLCYFFFWQTDLWKSHSKNSPLIPLVKLCHWKCCFYSWNSFHISLQIVHLIYAKAHHPATISQCDLNPKKAEEKENISMSQEEQERENREEEKMRKRHVANQIQEMR